MFSSNYSSTLCRQFSSMYCVHAVLSAGSSLGSDKENLQVAEHPSRQSAAHHALSHADRATDGQLTFQRDHSNTYWPLLSLCTPVGIHNTGNTCYIAAALQVCCTVSSFAMSTFGLNTNSISFVARRVAGILGLCCK